MRTLVSTRPLLAHGRDSPISLGSPALCSLGRVPKPLLAILAKGPDVGDLSDVSGGFPLMVNCQTLFETKSPIGDAFVLFFRTCGRPSALRGVPGTSTHLYGMGTSFRSSAYLPHKDRSIRRGSALGVPTHQANFVPVIVPVKLLALDVPKDDGTGSRVVGHRKNPVRVSTYP